MKCPMVSGSPKGGTCLLCASPLPGRRIKWCRDECSDTYWSNHAWGVARGAALRRDGWTCVRCGHIGWSDVPRHILAIETRDHDLDPPGAGSEDWAVAIGLLDPQDLASLSNWQDDQRRYERVRDIVAQLPVSIETLILSERRKAPSARWPRPSSHELEVNHIEPRRGGGYGNGCHHHLDNLETLCRPCHTDETRRQRLSLPSWRHDDRAVEILLGRGVQEVLV